MCKGPGAGVSYQPLLLLPAACYIPALVATFSTSFFGLGHFQPIMYSLNKPSPLWVPVTHTCLRYCPYPGGIDTVSIPDYEAFLLCLTLYQGSPL